MGASCKVTTHSHGFYPAGGGKWKIQVEPCKALLPFEMVKSGAQYANELDNCSLRVLVSQLPDSIAQRELSTAKDILNWQKAESQVKHLNSLCPGNTLALNIKADGHTAMFEVVGEQGISSESVAKRAAGRVNKFLHSQAAVEEHLADQLLLLMAIAGSGSFTTTTPSLHTTTNIAVIKQLLGTQIKLEQLAKQLWKVEVQ